MNRKIAEPETRDDHRHDAQCRQYPAQAHRAPSVGLPNRRRLRVRRRTVTGGARTICLASRGGMRTATSRRRIRWHGVCRRAVAQGVGVLNLSWHFADETPFYAVQRDCQCATLASISAKRQCFHGGSATHARTPSQGPRFRTSESARTLFWSGPRPVGEPSYARHVGQVGALAVALGIGSGRCRSGCGVGRYRPMGRRHLTPLTVLLAPVLRVNRQLSTVRGRGSGSSPASAPDAATETNAPSSGGTSESASPSVTSTEVAPGVALSLGGAHTSQDPDTESPATTTSSPSASASDQSGRKAQHIARERRGAAAAQNLPVSAASQAVRPWPEPEAPAAVKSTSPPALHPVIRQAATLHQG